MAAAAFAAFKPFKPSSLRIIRRISSFKLSANKEIKSTLPNVEIPKVPIDELVFKDADKWGHKIAVECGETGRKYTYDELRRRIENFSRALQSKFKLKKGDVVAIMLPNVPEYPIASLGSLKAGLVVTPINPIYTTDEITRQLNDSNAKIFITLGILVPAVKQALTNLKRNIPILVVKTQINESLESGIVDFQNLVEQTFDGEFKNNFDDAHSLALLPYSSGTTGLPKGVELTNYNLCANVMQCTIPEVGMFEKSLGKTQDVTVAILPMFHIYGTETLFWFFSFGIKTVTLPKFTPESYAKSLFQHKPNALFIVPPIVIYLNVYPGITKEHLENVRYVNSGAAPLGALDEEKLQEKAQKPIEIVQGYGLSESPVVTFTPLTLENKIPGSVGIPIPNTMVKVVSSSSEGEEVEKALGPNKRGEMYVKGPQVMRGYFNNPQATKEAFTEDGWFKTGDMVYFNEEGQFFVTDRIKELIKVKGFQVAPAELEEIIRDFPGVSDACVIGVPHQFFGEVPRAYIVTNKANFNTQSLQEFVSSKVASYKRLDGGVEIVNSIPKNASGKLLRRQLKEQYIYENQ